jgi:hypothetical protein
MPSEARLKLVLCVCGVVVRKSSERVKAAKNPGCETAKGIDAEKVAWGGCSGIRQRRGHGATEEVSLLRPHAAAIESGIGNCAEQYRAKHRGCRAENRRRKQARRASLHEAGAITWRRRGTGCLRRTTYHGVESPGSHPLTTNNPSRLDSAAPTCRRELAAAPEREGATAQLARRSRELSVSSTYFGVLWHDSSSQPLCHRRSYNRGPR